MAKDKKVAAPAAKKSGPPRKEHKFNIDDIAKIFDVNPATMRGKLRNADIETDGGSYGWDSQKAMDEVVAAVKAATPPATKPVAKPKAKAAGTAKPAVAKKSVKKAA